QVDKAHRLEQPTRLHAHHAVVASLDIANLLPHGRLGSMPGEMHAEWLIPDLHGNEIFRLQLSPNPLLLHEETGVILDVSKTQLRATHDLNRRIKRGSRRVR